MLHTPWDNPGGKVDDRPGVTQLRNDRSVALTRVCWPQIQGSAQPEPQRGVTPWPREPGPHGLQHMVATEEAGVCPSVSQLPRPRARLYHLSRHNKLLITPRNSKPEVYFYSCESAIYLSIEASKGKGPGAIYKQTVAPGDIPGEAKLSRNELVAENQSPGTEGLGGPSGSGLTGGAKG